MPKEDFLYHNFCFIFNILCLTFLWHAAVYHISHITFPEHHIPLRVIKFSLFLFIFFIFISSRDKVHWICHPCDPIHSDRILYCLATFTPHVRMSLQNNPYSFPLILTSGGTAATPAIKQLIYLTWKLMIAKDSYSGDNKGRGNPGKIELDWSASEQTNGPVTEGNSYTLSSIAQLVNPDFCLMLCRNKTPFWAQT